MSFGRAREHKRSRSFLPKPDLLSPTPTRKRLYITAFHLLTSSSLQQQTINNCQYAFQEASTQEAITSFSRYITLLHLYTFADMPPTTAKLETQNLIHEAIMSDTLVTEAPVSQFTPKEQALLIAAMSSLKSGM